MLVAGWVGVILVITSWPNPPQPSSAPPGLDKVIHFSLYGVLGALAARAMASGSARRSLVAAGAIAAFAALDEWHQRWIPGRGADRSDWFADVAGAATGLALVGRRGRTAIVST
jgi:VanZ family protein